MVATAITVLVGFCALTIDLGSMYLVRTELQRAADAAALAGVTQLTPYQEGLTEAAVKAEAERLVEANPVGARTVRLDLSRDVEFGQAIYDPQAQKYTFSPGGTGVPNAIRVTVRKTADSPNGAMPLFFANLFGMSEKNMWAQAAAMLVPRDIAIVADLSGSMSDDSELRNYKDTPINLWNVWICLPVQRGTNGTGDGIYPPAAGVPVDQSGRYYADPAEHPEYAGPVFARMNNWGTLVMTTSYSPTSDPGLEYLPYGQSWSGNTALKTWLQNVGYNTSEINAICSGSYDSSYYQYRVRVALGLARWDSGISGGLWSKLPPGVPRSGNADSRISSGEITSLVSYPWSGGSWTEYITYMRSTSTYMYQTDSSFRYRFGLKTLVNYLMESHPRHADTADLADTPEQPMQAVEDAVAYCMDILAQCESDDHVSLEIFAETAHHMQDLTGAFTTVGDTLRAMQAGHFDTWTFTGGGIALAISELTGPRARPNAHKYIFLLSDGQANVTKTGTVNDYEGGKAYALQEAQRAVNLGIQFHCVSVGFDSDRPFMQQIAQMGKGKEFFASGTIDEYSSELMAIFAELSSKRPIRLIE
jgi:hypothetical protein